MVAGEARWQIGIVETHIRLLKNQPHLMEDEFPEASIKELVEHCVAAKARRQKFKRIQSVTVVVWNSMCSGRFRHMDLEKIDRVCERPQYARSLVLRTPTVGQLVKCFRRSKGGVGGGRHRGLGGKMVLLGTASVSAVEQPTEVEPQVAAVVWLVCGGSLIRAAPELV